MKNIFLIGDSIRHGSYVETLDSKLSPGYGVYVKEKLEAAGLANVCSPDENSRWAQYTLRFLHKWAKEVPDPAKVDVVHWNNGLWDAVRLFGDEPLTPIEFYELMLPRVYNRIRLLFPNAKIIFATSTAVIEEMSRPQFTRRNTEIMQYNEVAKKVMAQLNVPINDLWAVTENWGPEMHADWVHFNEEGCRILADKVIEAIDTLA
jgi:lysophospholipase L1-like esterase